MDSAIITKYFPSLSDSQQEAFGRLGELYTDWNAKINVVSRRDIDNLYLHHVLHSLAIASFLGPLADGTTLLDVGTGGGFPGIPLAICYPQCRLHLVDRIGKKIRVASAVAEAVGLENVTFQHGDVGECHQRYCYVVSRAVMPLNSLYRLVRRNILPTKDTPAGNAVPNGLVVLKGGDLTDESAGIPGAITQAPVADFFPEPFFAEKSIVYIPGSKS